MGPKLLLLFIIGDILGTGIYAMTGNVARQVGGVVWLPFLIAFIVATLTAFSYLELVTKYPQAAGAALYTHKAFGVHFVTFLVAFAVMCSGITSASTASRAFAANFGAMISVVREDWMGGAPFEPSDTLTTVLAVIFISLIAAINLRGVAGSVKTNVVLTCVELTGLLIVIFVGFFAMVQGRADLSRVASSTHRRIVRSSLRLLPRQPWPSSRWSVSRTRSTWPRRSRSLSESSPRSC